MNKKQCITLILMMGLVIGARAEEKKENIPVEQTQFEKSLSVGKIAAGAVTILAFVGGLYYLNVRGGENKLESEVIESDDNFVEGLADTDIETSDVCEEKLISDDIVEDSNVIDNFLKRIELTANNITEKAYDAKEYVTSDEFKEKATQKKINCVDSVESGVEKVKNVAKNTKDFFKESYRWVRTLSPKKKNKSKKRRKRFIKKERKVYQEKKIEKTVQEEELRLNDQIVLTEQSSLTQNQFVLEEDLRKEIDIYQKVDPVYMEINQPDEALSLDTKLDNKKDSEEQSSPFEDLNILEEVVPSDTSEDATEEEVVFTIILEEKELDELESSKTVAKVSYEEPLVVEIEEINNSDLIQSSEQNNTSDKELSFAEHQESDKRLTVADKQSSIVNKRNVFVAGGITVGAVIGYILMNRK